MIVPCTIERLEELLEELENQRLDYIRVFKTEEGIFIDYFLYDLPKPLLNNVVFHHQAYQCLKHFIQTYRHKSVKDIFFEYAFDQGPHLFRASYHDVPQLIENHSTSMTKLLTSCLSLLDEKEIPISQLLYRPNGRKKSQKTHLKEVIHVLLKELESDET